MLFCGWKEMLKRVSDIWEDTHGVSGNAVNCLIAVMCFQLCDTGFGHGVVLYGVYRYSGRAVVLLVSQATVIKI